MSHQAWDTIRHASLWLNSARLMTNGMLESGWQLPRSHASVWVSLVSVRLSDKNKERKIIFL